MKIARVQKIVLDRVARPGNHGAFESLNRANKVALNFKRQTRGDAVRIDFIGVQSFGFNKYLMRCTVCKTHDLVFN